MLCFSVNFIVVLFCIFFCHTVFKFVHLIVVMFMLHYVFHFIVFYFHVILGCFPCVVLCHVVLCCEM